MRDAQVGRVFRAIRHRKGWRQSDLSARIGVSQQEISEIELGRIEGVTVRTIRRVATGLEIELPFAPRWRGPELDRLLDAEHAALVEPVLRLLRTSGWETLAEWSFNHYGERGSVDILAWHAATRTLLVVEVKSRIVDLQDLLASHDRKCRIAPELIARERGWRAIAIGRLLVLPERPASRSAVARLGVTFGTTYPTRNRGVVPWLRRPEGPLAGILFVAMSIGSRP